MTLSHAAHHRALCSLTSALCVWTLAIPTLSADPGSSNSNSQTSDTSSNSSNGTSGAGTTNPGVTTGELIEQTSSQVGVTSLQAFAVVFTIALLTVTIGGTTLGVTWSVSGDYPQLARLQYYLREHQPAVQQAIAFGGGPILDDLADMFDLPPAGRARFGLILRRAQPALLSIINKQITLQVAADFAQTTLALLIADPLLGPEVFSRGATSLQLTTSLPDAYYDPAP